MKFAVVSLALLANLWGAAALAAEDPPASDLVRVSVRSVSPEARKPVTFESVGGLIVFKAIVAGKEVWALLDTGADRSTMNIAFAQEAGLQATARTAKVSTPNGELDSWLIAPTAVTIPGQVEMTTPAIGLDLSTVSRVMGRRIDWIVGSEFFSSAGVQVDPGRKTFQFGPSGAAKIPDTIPSLAVSKDMKVELTVNGKPVTVAIDTGSDTVLSLTPEAWARVGAKDAALEVSSSVGADGVPHMLDIGRAEIGMGPLKRTNAAVRITPAFAKHGDGTVGMGLLGGLWFVLDVGAGKLWFAPRISSSPAGSTTAAPAG